VEKIRPQCSARGTHGKLSLSLSKEEAVIGLLRRKHGRYETVATLSKEARLYFYESGTEDVSGSGRQTFEALAH